MPATLELAVTAMLIAVVLGIPLGLVRRPEARRRRSARTIMAGSILGFIAADLLGRPDADHGVRGRARLAAVHRPRRRPRTLFGVAVSFLTWDGLRASRCCRRSTSRCSSISLLIRLTRAGTREALLQDYVKFARAKGLTPARVIGVHVLKNILIPIVTVIGLELGSMIAFAIVTETIFAWPGMGKLHHRLDQRARPAGDRRLPA